MLRTYICSVAFAAAFAGACASAAAAETAPDVPVDAPKADQEAARVAERPWLYADDATTPLPWQSLAGTRFTYSSGSSRDARPLASNLSAPGGLLEINAEIGVLRELSLAATGAMSFGDSLSGGVTIGFRIAPLARLKFPFRVVFGGGYLREGNSDNGIFLRVATTYDAGPVRFGVTLHGEHVFATGRDALDTLIILGANVKLSKIVRLGIEYVAQDVEGIFDDDEAEGGVRHFLGPTASFELLDKQLFLAFGPAVGLSHGSPGLVGRASVAFAF
ncbi:hypothetical protein BH09MYX1_BH09MYX1_09020 [soil metagenome]